MRSRRASREGFVQSASIHHVAPAAAWRAADPPRRCGVVRRGGPIDDDLERTGEPGGVRALAGPSRRSRQDVGAGRRLAVRPRWPGPRGRPSGPPGASSARAATRRPPRPGSAAAARAAGGTSSVRTGSARPRTRTARRTGGPRRSPASRRAAARVRAAIGLADVAEPRVVERSEPDRQDEAPVREVVERDDLARELPRPPARRARRHAPSRTRSVRVGDRRRRIQGSYCPRRRWRSRRR